VTSKLSRRTKKKAQTHQSLYSFSKLVRKWEMSLFRGGWGGVRVGIMGGETKNLLSSCSWDLGGGRFGYQGGGDKLVGNKTKLKENSLT